MIRVPCELNQPLNFASVPTFFFLWPFPYWFLEIFDGREAAIAGQPVQYESYDIRN